MAAFDGLQSIDRDELVKQLEAAAIDVEIMTEDLEMERELTREMAQDSALTNPPKALVRT